MTRPEPCAGRVKSVNVGRLVANPAKDNTTAIDKRPASGPIWVHDPGPAKGFSGLQGDSIGDTKHHGGRDQAVYVFAREDLDHWERVLARPLPDGMFGENLTTVGVDPNGALLGERWQVGPELVLQVTGPRIPCRTFAARMGETGWARRFSESGRPGAYLAVVTPGFVEAGDPVKVVRRPLHNVDVTMALFAFTIKPVLLKDLLAAGDDLTQGMRGEIEAQLAPSQRA